MWAQNFRMAGLKAEHEFLKREQFASAMRSIQEEKSSFMKGLGTKGS